MNEDIKFTYSGTSYEYMLAVDTKGQKRWAVQQLFKQPPSLLENKIDMVISAAATMRDLDDVSVDDRDIATIIAELRVLTDGDTITLVGYDAQTYYVTFDQNATNSRAVTDDSGRITEYEIDISCWDLYQ